MTKPNSRYSLSFISDTDLKTHTLATISQFRTGMTSQNWGGWDVENQQRNIFAEFKNKHNTMNAGAAKTVHARMSGLVEGNSRAICYWVEVIAKTSQDIQWKLPGVRWILHSLIMSC